MPRKSTLLSIGLGALLLSSCSAPWIVAQRATKVDVVTLETDILFGAPKPGAAAALVAPESLFPPPQPAFDFFTPFPITRLAPAVGPCPTAPATAFPAEVAESTVTKMPTAGHYRWAAKGTYDVMVATFIVPLPLPQFEDRYVRHPATFTDTTPTPPGSQPSFDVTYETIEPHIGAADSYLFFWQVKANSTVPTASTPAGVTTPSDPEGGLVLKKIDTIDAKGVDTGTIFNGTPGLLMLPLPVSPGATINSTALDSSGKVNNLQLMGTVGNHERIDACGEPIQAWGVDGTLTVPSTSGASTAIHYDVATQMGALMVAFKVDGSYLGTTFHKVETRIGQAKGDPLPKKYE